MTQQEERLRGLIAGVRGKTGLFSSKVWDVVVNDRRIVFAELAKRMLGQAAAPARAEACYGRVRGW